MVGDGMGLKPRVNVRAAALLALASLSLMGCAQGLEGLVASSQADAFLQTGSVRQTTPTTALASLPREAGRVVSVQEQRRADGLQQHIVLSGDPLASGENWIKVEVAAHRPDGAPRHGLIVAQMQSIFAGRDLPIYNYVISNEHGPVGLAFGGLPELGTCAFIWQEVEQDRVQASDRLPMARAAGVWSVRVRLCRERLTLEHAIAFAQGLSLGAFSDPLYAPLANATQNGPTSSPASALASLDEPATAAPRARTARAPATVVSPAPPAVRTATGASPGASPVANSIAIPLPGSPAAPIAVATAPANSTPALIAIPLPR